MFSLDDILDKLEEKNWQQLTGTIKIIVMLVFLLSLSFDGIISTRKHQIFSKSFPSKYFVTFSSIIITMYWQRFSLGSVQIVLFWEKFSI